MAAWPVAWVDLPDKIDQIRSIWAMDLAMGDYHEMPHYTEGLSEPQSQFLVLCTVADKCEGKLSLEDLVCVIEGEDNIAKRLALLTFCDFVNLGSDVDGRELLQEFCARVSKS